MMNQWFKKSWAFSFTALILASLLAVACGSAAAPEKAKDTSASSGAASSAPKAVSEPAETEVNPGKLTIMVGDLATERFDIGYVGGSPGGANYGRVVHGMLISQNASTEMLPGIAEAWELSDDGLTTTFTIREGAKFHDGSEITPEDVLWTLRNSFGPGAHELRTADSTAAAISRLMDTIELSGNNVSVTTKQPLVSFSGNVSEIGDKWYGMMPARDELYDDDAALAYDQNPIAAGPMSLVDHERASVMKFERFDDFYYQPANGFSEDKRVKFQSLDMFLVQEESTRVAALRTGEADIVPASLAVREQIEKDGGRLVFGAEGTYVYAWMVGCYDPAIACNDKRVRQALDYSIDKELLRDTLYGEEVFQVKGWSIVTPSTYGYTPAIDPRPFDPAKARELLADAGYKTPDHPDGKDFGPLIINTWAATGMPNQVEAAQLAADKWTRELGLDVEVRVADSTGTKKRQKANELNGQILWRENEARKDATINTSSAYGDPERKINQTHSDTELFRIVQEARAVIDLEEREQVYKDLYVRLRDETYQFGVGYVNIPWGVGPRVETWEPYPLSLWVSAYHTITLN
jgi:ABC-type transport system substrate-binding protein